MSGRGRGRRAKEPIVADNPEENDKKAKIPARGGRKKQFPIVAVVTPDGIEGNLQPESRRPLIAHLSIQSRDITLHDEPIKYNPAPPSDVAPFGSFLDNPFAQDSDYAPIDSEQKNTTIIPEKPVIVHSPPPTVAPIVKHDNIDYYAKGQVLVQFKDSEETRQIPEKSGAACYWCCHTFDTRPVVLPVHDHGVYINVYGNFCCPECAMAYLFDSHQDSHTRWEQLALLNRIYADAIGGKVNPAPPRNVLAHFGGIYTIDEYRTLIRQQKIRVDTHLPPMVSILATMDTKPIDFYDVSLTKNVMETVKERLQKAEEVLKLRRTKPLKAWESTLDACINLKVAVM